MKHSRMIAMLFEQDNQSLVTTMDSRSRLRFKKLIRNYVPGGKVLDTPPVGAAFSYVLLNSVLSSVEEYYNGLRDTQAGEHIARNVMTLTQGIRVQNDEEDEEDDDNE